MRRIGSLLFVLAGAGTVSAGQLPDLPSTPKTSLTDSLSQEQTVSNLSARLRLLSGDLDPALFKNLLEQFKKNPNINKDDLLKNLGAKDGGKSVADFEKMLNGDPSALDSLKNLFGKGGPNGLDPETLKNWIKQLSEGGLKGSQFDPLKMPKLEGGNLDGAIPKFDGQLPDMKAGKFELPDGSNQFLKDLVKGWEKNVGSIDANPDLKNALDGLLNKGGGFNPGDLKKWLGESGFDLGKLDGLIGKNPPKFKLPELPDGPKTIKLPNWQGPSWGTPTAPSLPSAPSLGGWSFPSFGGGGAGAAVPVLIVLALIAGAFLVWWMWPQIQATFTPKIQAALPFPDGFDPRSVKDRESLVKAFEVLSMLLCGDGAKVWNHKTIATALREYLAKDPDGIDRLAVMYALARYTPAGESLHPDSVAEARKTLCQLAGVPAA